MDIQRRCGRPEIARLVFRVDAHHSVRQYVSPPDIPPHTHDDDGNLIVGDAHDRWAQYMGALLSPWETGYKDNPMYGRAGVRDWKTLMEWVRGVRKDTPRGYIQVTNDAGKKLRRDRCRVWLLNSMARNLGFDKNKARLYNAWRFKHARKVAAVVKNSRETKMEIATREAVNTLTLKSINENTVFPAAWYTTENRLRLLQKQAKSLFKCDTAVKRRQTARYQSRKTKNMKWVERQLEALKKPLPPEEEKTDNTPPRSYDQRRRLGDIIAGRGTKEPGELDTAQERVVRETFALASKPQQFLILVDGGPGTGKTKTTTRLAEALNLLNMTTAYTGSTGTAATNYKNGYTLHSMMGFGRKMCSSKALKKKYANVTTRTAIMKRLGGSQPGKIVLVIDEISGLKFDVFGATEHALRVLYNNDKKFSGISVVLVGDFDQKLPVGKGTSLAQQLVNTETDPKYMSDKKVSMRQAANVFGMFTKYELTTNHRLKGAQKELRDILATMKNHQESQPITRGFLKRLPQLERLDTMTKADRKKWQFCPIMCTGNATRQRINELKAIEYGKAKNLPILVYYDQLSNVTDPKQLNRLSRVVRLQHPIKHYWVVGAPAILTQNTKGYTHRGVVNSAMGTMWSITWSEGDRTDENVCKWFSGDLEGGKIYEVPFPHAITVKMKKTKDLFPVVQSKDTCPVPK